MISIKNYTSKLAEIVQWVEEEAHCYVMREGQKIFDVKESDSDYAAFLKAKRDLFSRKVLEELNESIDISITRTEYNQIWSDAMKVSFTIWKI